METNSAIAGTCVGGLEAGLHQEAVSVDGLDDLFQWASEMVAEPPDGRLKRSREQRIRRTVLDLIQQSKRLEAQARFSEELSYLQRRVIALLQALQEKTEENTLLRQIMVAQYFGMQRIPRLEEEVKQLEKMTWFREEAEEERKHLMAALSRMKKERDYLDELLTANEGENTRLGQLLGETRMQLDILRSRRWWHRLAECLGLPACRGARYAETSLK